MLIAGLAVLQWKRHAIPALDHCGSVINHHFSLAGLYGHR